MKKPGLTALIGLAAVVWGVSSAQAQLLIPLPGLGTAGRGPYGPVGGGYGGFGGIFGQGTTAGAAPYGPGIGVNVADPGAGYGMATGAGFGLNGAFNPSLNLNQGFVTGHPVAFQNHRGYFLNLNAAAGAPTQFGGGATQPNLPGTAGAAVGTTTNPTGPRPKPKTGGR